MISGSGALVVRTGKRTGRSPKDRFIVENEITKEAVDWGTGNKAFPSDAFGALLDKARRRQVFVYGPDILHPEVSQRHLANRQIHSSPFHPVEPDT